MAEVLTSPLLGGSLHGFGTRDHDPQLGGYTAMLRQVHGAEVVTVISPLFDSERPDSAGSDNAEPDSERPAADGMVTACRGVALSIVTADCAPVLLADAETGVIGAAHAGWRGAQAGVLEACVAAMAAQGARKDRIAAVIGPCIARGSYEVDAGMRDCFAPEDAMFFYPSRSGHWQFDLPAYAQARLAQAGVENTAWLGLDTYADPARFYSYRRATHDAAPTSGRQISAIALAA